MRQVLSMALCPVTYCINLFVAVQNIFCFRVPEAESRSHGSTSFVDRTPIRRDSTSHVPTPIRRRSTSHVQAPIRRESTSHVQAPIRRESTSHVPTPIRRESTSHVPTPIRRESTSHVPTPIRRESTSHVPTPIRRESTSHVPTPIRRESTSDVPTPIRRESTSQVDQTPIDSRMAGKEGQWSNLPHDLLFRIACSLGLMDFLSFRCVCKDWHIASSKVSHEDKSSVFEPWFLIYEGEGSQCSLLNNQHKRYTSQHILELDGATCLASHEGWLLLFRQSSLFFFCPFSKAKIELPNCPVTSVTDLVAAFSSVPTAEDCTVVVLNRFSSSELHLSMLRRGKKVWKKYSFLGRNFNRIKTALFYEEDEFHFLDGKNGLIAFSASKNPKWNSYDIQPSTDLSSDILVLNYTVRNNHCQRNNGIARLLKANDSISTCGTTVPHSSGEYDMIIGSESIEAPNQSPRSRRLKGVWIQPKYCYVPPGLTW